VPTKCYGYGPFSFAWGKRVPIFRNVPSSSPPQNLDPTFTMSATRSAHFATLGLSLALCFSSVAAPESSSTRAPHPRLLITDWAEFHSTFDGSATTQDPLRAELLNAVIARATRALDEPLVRYEIPDGLRLLAQSRLAFARITNTALAYRLTEDSRFLNRARDELLAAAALPDWNPRHFLDVGEMATAVALGYDWLHDVLTPEERTAIEDALRRHALSFAHEAYVEKSRWWTSAKMNWNQVCNAGLLLAALALDDLEAETRALVTRGATESISLAFETYRPDGGYHEGAQYWDYGTSYHVIAAAALESALGDSHSLVDTPEICETLRFRLHVEGPSMNPFNFGDNTESGVGYTPAYSWLATRHGNAAALAHARRVLAYQLVSGSAHPSANRFLALGLLWFPEKPVDGAHAAEPLDSLFRGDSEVAFFRSAWDDTDAIYAGLKAGSNAVSHAQLDLGTFILEWAGVRWLMDMGRDSYDLPKYFDSRADDNGEPLGQRWSYYRMTNFAHNTITVNGRRQSPLAEARIVKFESSPEWAFAIADLTKASGLECGSLRRGLGLANRRTLYVQDELTDAPPNTRLEWRAFTRTEILAEENKSNELAASAGPRSIRLRQAGREVIARLHAPTHAHFSFGPAPSGGPGENANEGINELKIELLATTGDTQIQVSFTPVDGKADEGQTFPNGRTTALSEW